MAVGLVASGTPQLVNGTTDGTPAIPAGSNGDMLVIIAASSSNTPTTPAGWNAKYTGVQVAGGTYLRHVYWRVRDGSEGSTVTLAKGGSSYSLFGQVIALSGANATHPIGAFSFGKTNSPGIPQLPGIFVPAGSAVIASCFTVNTFTSVTPPSNGGGVTWTEVADMGGSAYCTAVGIVSTEQAMPAKTWLPSGGTNAQVEGFTLAIMPANRRDEFIRTTGSGSQVAPAGTSEVVMEAVGGGGGGSVTTGAEGGGEGACYARSNPIAVTPSSSTLFYSVGTGGGPGAAGGDSWIRKDTNGAPSGGQESTGVSATRGEGGSPAGSTGGGGGNTPVGHTTAEGGDGANGQGGGGSRAGSGGGQAGQPDGTVGQAGNAGASSTAGLGGEEDFWPGLGGNGGLSANVGLPGQFPGGGGGGGGNSGGNAGSGASGYVRLIYTLSGPVVGMGTETDTAFNRGMVAGHGQSNETDTASAIFPKVVLATQRPIETDSAFQRSPVLQPQRATETDLAFALSQGIVQLPVGRADTTQTAFKAGGIAMAPNRPIETDSAFNRGMILQVGRANETDAALQLNRLGGVGVAIETDVALAPGKLFILPCGGRNLIANGNFDQAYLGDWVEFDTDAVVTAGRMRVTSTVDGDQSQMVNINASLVSGRWYRWTGEGFPGTQDALIESSSQALDPKLNISFSEVFQSISSLIQVQCRVGDHESILTGDWAEFDNIGVFAYTVETDTAFALNRLDTPAWTHSNETDTAFGFTVGISHGRSNETDLAFARTAIFIRAVTRADEVDTAFARNPGVNVPLGRSDEADTASRLGFGTPAVRANETNTAFARSAVIPLALGMAIEIDTAFQMFGALEAGSRRKPNIDLRGLLRDRVQPVYGSSVFS